MGSLTNHQEIIMLIYVHSNEQSMEIQKKLLKAGAKWKYKRDGLPLNLHGMDFPLILELDIIHHTLMWVALKDTDEAVTEALYVLGQKS